MLMSVMLGTVFFALVQNSIDNGFRSGMLISVGVIISDIILITITLYNSSLIPRGSITEAIVRICGAVFLIFYGIANLRKSESVSYPTTRRSRRIFFYIRTGFLLNILNPGNLVGWAVVSTNLAQVAQYSTRSSTTFYIAALSAIFGMELLISLGAMQLKRFITEKLLLIIDRAVGILFLGFSVVLLWPVIYYLFK
jgi:threonine/homoserine/homoserine lactone efflux protein